VLVYSYFRIFILFSRLFLLFSRSFIWHIVPMLFLPLFLVGRQDAMLLPFVSCGLFAAIVLGIIY